MLQVLDLLTQLQGVLCLLHVLVLVICANGAVGVRLLDPILAFGLSLLAKLLDLVGQGLACLFAVRIITNALNFDLLG